MKPLIKKIWVKALKSGKYRQGKKFLATKNGRYCCLGVLCDLYAKENKKKWDKGIVRSLFGEEKVLPLEVISWAGLSPFDSNPAVNTTKEIIKKFPALNNGREGLASMNDEGVSFKQIATCIDKSL